MSPKSKTGATSKKASMKVFISYAHKDEGFKNELLTMLAGLENQKVINIWQDRKIEGGESWYNAIQTAMKACDMALLLVSQHFLASQFIQREEVPLLLKQRMQQGLRVIPIIVRPCLWQDDPVLSKIQVLPKDGKAVVSFPKANGRRDQVWVDIAQSIGRRAKAQRR